MPGPEGFANMPDMNIDAPLEPNALEKMITDMKAKMPKPQNLDIGSME